MARKAGGRSTKGAGNPKQAESYRHPEAESLLRPDVGTQAQFRKKKPPKTYRYDSSLSPALDWDGQNPSREFGEWLLRQIEEAAALPAPHEFPEPRTMRSPAGVVEVRGLEDAVDQLRRLGKPFLDWAGKAERLSFDVPTLPLFVHERLSTKAILETLKGHKRDRQLGWMDLFADPQHPIHDQVLRAYEHPEKWVNRLVLGDSLVVMNSLLHYESLGGQVQMIYMDPPYGVKFGSNFQPFVRKRDVSHNDDEDMTREPEMVKAYRDTWELGLHSYLTYLRDRLLLCRELLSPKGSIFLQINDERVHEARAVMDEVFGEANFISTIIFQKTSSEEGEGVANTADYLLWYCRERDRFCSYPLFREKRPGEPGAKQYVYAQSPDGKTRRKLTPDEISNPESIPAGWKICRVGYPLTSQHFSPTRSGAFSFQGEPFSPGANRQWSIDPESGLPRLVEKGRIYKSGKSLSGIMFLDDVPGTEIGNVWMDTGTGSFTQEQIYVVQTSEKVIERCVLMATEPGDLILDPTCGSGTTAYGSEKWGRRWITIDTSRVPLALTRQRLLSATYPYFRLKDEARGPSGGLDYQPASISKNRKADGVGIRVQHSLSSIAEEVPPEEIIFRQNPEIDYRVTRISGPFTVEASIPTPVDWDADGVEDSGVSTEEHRSFVDRMLEVLRKSPVLHLTGGKTVTLHQVRPPAKTLSLSAEAIVPAAGADLRPRDAAEEQGQYPIPETESVGADPARARREPIAGAPVALVFGPESGAVSEKLVFEAAREAHAKGYAHLYVIGFAIQPNARELVEKCDAVVGVSATYVQATPDLMMGDLLKNMRSSQIFSVCGLPEVEIHEAAPEKKGDPPRFQAELKGLDVFDPTTMETDHRAGADVPCWLLDTDYNALCFHVCQAFFPRTAAWDDLKRSLRGEFEDSVWDHLAGTTSAPFEAGEHRQIAVKVIDDRGNELLVVKPLPKAGR